MKAGDWLKLTQLFWLLSAALFFFFLLVKLAMTSLGLLLAFFVDPIAGLPRYSSIPPNA